MTKILNLNNDSTHINQKNQFEEERNRLKQEIENLEKENDLLSNQLSLYFLININKKFVSKSIHMMILFLN